MTQEYRTEKDSLGEMRVPADALFGAQTQRAAINFPVSGMRPYPAFVWAQAIVKRAAAEVNRDLGLLDAKLAGGVHRARNSNVFAWADLTAGDRGKVYRIGVK
jgi:fumarate hydratase, class II